MLLEEGNAVEMTTLQCYERLLSKHVRKKKGTQKIPISTLAQKLDYYNSCFSNVSNRHKET